MSSAAWSRPSSANYPQREIADAAFELQQQIDADRRIVVGVNSFQALDEEPIPTLRIDPDARAQADRASARHPRPARRRRRRATLAACARPPPPAREPDGPAARLRPRLRLRGRDHRVAAAGLRRLLRDTRLLSRVKTPASTARGGEQLAGRGRLHLFLDAHWQLLTVCPHACAYDLPRRVAGAASQCQVPRCVRSTCAGGPIPILASASQGGVAACRRACRTARRKRPRTHHPTCGRRGQPASLRTRPTERLRRAARHRPRRVAAARLL